MGDGNGESFPWVDPKPRDFQLGIFKCRSTPTGTLPTDQDLFDTIARGLDRSNMPQWSTFTKQERADLVAWVKHFSPRWVSEKPGTPITIPPEPEVTRGAHQGGARCICPSAVLEVPRRARPGQWTVRRNPSPMISAARSRLSTLLRERGQNAAIPISDIYRIFMTGLDGTPMPSFADNIKPDEAWDLVFYLRTFMPQNSKEKEMAKQLGLKPVDPNAPAGQQ